MSEYRPVTFIVDILKVSFIGELENKELRCYRYDIVGSVVVLVEVHRIHDVRFT